MAQSITRTASNVVCPKIGQTFRLTWLNRPGSSIDRKVPGCGAVLMRQTTAMTPAAASQEVHPQCQPPAGRAAVRTSDENGNVVDARGFHRFATGPAMP